MTVAILGAGWVGAALGRALAARGDSVHAATTTPEKLDVFRAAGMQPFLLNVTHNGVTGDNADVFFEADALVITLPPGRRAREDAALYVQQILAVSYAAEEMDHVVYTSSTSVYPNLEGAPLLDETYPVTKHTAARESGAACLIAEAFLEEPTSASTVLRLGGLYGPGRTPARYLAGRSDLEGGDRPVNLVHRDDVIAAALHVIEGRVEGTFNLVADEHPARRDFYPAAAVALGLKPPAFTLSTGSVLGKCVSNARAKAELGLSFRTLDPTRHAEDTATDV
ncbi:MAG: NAD(P)-binding domain-containing protein [Bacteroidota bacterium]